LVALALGAGVLIASPWAGNVADTAAEPRVDVLAQTSAPVSSATPAAVPTAAPSSTPVSSAAPGAAAVTSRAAHPLPAPATPARARTPDVVAKAPAAPAAQAAPAAPAAAPAQAKAASDPAPPAPKPPVNHSDGTACYATAIPGGLVLGDNQQHNAGGPNFTSSACGAIHIKLTSAVYRTHARSCLETASGSAITSCSSWILLSYPDTWDTLSRNVPSGSRWQIQMYAEGPERVSFSYTA
jgi:hypothetical protein